MRTLSGEGGGGGETSGQNRKVSPCPIKIDAADLDYDQQNNKFGIYFYKYLNIIFQTKKLIYSVWRFICL